MDLDVLCCICLNIIKTKDYEGYNNLLNLEKHSDLSYIYQYVASIKKSYSNVEYFRSNYEDFTIKVTYGLLDFQKDVKESFNNKSDISSDIIEYIKNEWNTLNLKKYSSLTPKEALYLDTKLRKHNNNYEMGIFKETYLHLPVELMNKEITNLYDFLCNFNDLNNDNLGVIWNILYQIKLFIKEEKLTDKELFYSVISMINDKIDNLYSNILLKINERSFKDQDCFYRLMAVNALLYNVNNVFNDLKMPEKNIDNLILELEQNFIRDDKDLLLIFILYRNVFYRIQDYYVDHYVKLYKKKYRVEEYNMKEALIEYKEYIDSNDIELNNFLPDEIYNEYMRMLIYHGIIEDDKKESDFDDEDIPF